MVDQTKKEINNNIQPKSNIEFNEHQSDDINLINLSEIKSK